MHEDSIQEVVHIQFPDQRGSLLRPKFQRDDSFQSEHKDDKKRRPSHRPASLRPTMANAADDYALTSPAMRSNYQPEWAQDPTNTVVPPSSVKEHGSPEDHKDMIRMGRAQEMRRVFRQFSLISFGCLSQCTWEFVLLNNNQALLAGGPALLFWSYVWSFAGSLLVTASLAEMCSMIPASSGQMAWVSEFASADCQQFLSYITGWMTLIGWQFGNAAGVFLTGSLIQSITVLYRPEDAALMWRTVVIMIPCLAFVIMVNVYGARAIATVQNLSMSVHILALIAIVVIMWVFSPHIPTNEALFKIENTQWPSTALVLLVGQVNANFSCSYSDSPIHLAEEVHDAAIVVPKALMRSLWISGICGLIAVVTFVFSVPNVADALDHPTGYSLLYVLQLSVPNGVIVCVLLVLFGLVGVSNVGFAAATARVTYTFARDRGLPFSDWTSKLSKGRMPVNAVFLTAAISIILSLLNLGSTTAFYAIVSMAQASQSASYLLAITCILYRRIKSPETLPVTRWSLGVFWGPVINVLSILFSINCFIWSFSPPDLPVTSTNFNVAGPVFTALLILMMATYYFKARKVYVGPVVRTRDTPNWNMSQFGTGQSLRFLTMPE